MTRKQKAVIALWMLAGVPLAVGAVAGLALSYSNVVDVVTPIVGDQGLARVFPLTWDVILAGAALAYLATAFMGKPRQMWRVISQCGAVGTVLVNATAAHDWPSLVVHLSGPIAWAVLVEAAASQLRGGGASQPAALGESVPLRLWLTAPVESARTWLRLARRVEGEQAAARLEVGAYAAAVEALRLTLPGRANKPTRGILRRQLRAGSLPPRAVLAACGWLDPDQPTSKETDPAQRILRAALGSALGPSPDVAGDQPDPDALVEVSVEVVSGADSRPVPEPAAPQIEPQRSGSSGVWRNYAGDRMTTIRNYAGDVVDIPAAADLEKAAQPVVAARQERPAAVTVAAVDDDPAGAGAGAADGDDALLAAARAVADQVAARGERLTRAVLLDGLPGDPDSPAGDPAVPGLRARGHACGNTKAGHLLARLRPAESA